MLRFCVLMCVVITLATAELQCTELPGDNIGINIDCSQTCQRVCDGLSDCPCNDNGRGIGCWIPRGLAHEICEQLKECHTISNYHGSPESALPFYSGWSHLGGEKTVQSIGFVAAACDRSFEKARSGCYECSVECDATSEECSACFETSHSTAITHPSDQYCQDYDGFQNSICAKCDCCTFMAKNMCVFNENRCAVPLIACESDVTNDMSDSQCASFLEMSRHGIEPSIASRCNCLNAVRHRIAAQYSGITNGTSIFQKFECSIQEGGFHSLLEWMNECRTVVPCSASDQCSGCRTFQTASEPSIYYPLISAAHTPNAVCGVFENGPETSCVVRTGDGVLHTDSPCGMHNATSFIESHSIPFLTSLSPITYPSALPSPSVTPSSRRFFDEEEDSRGHVLTHAEIRGDPVVDSNAPSSSPQPHTIPTDLSHTTIGNAITHRHYTDTQSSNHTFHVILPCVVMGDVGYVVEWSLYASRPGVVHVQILRETSVPAQVDNRNSTIRAFQIIGENILYVPSIGNHSFPISPANRIHVSKGDIIGFYSESHGVISWSAGGSTVLYRYGTPQAGSPATLANRPRVFHPPANIVLFAGPGVDRTYSIAVTGRFGDEFDDELVQNPATNGFEGSGSNPWVGTFPIPEAASDCSMGAQYWCLSVDRMHQCNIPESLWKEICSIAPSPSPVCDPLMQCPDGYIVRKFESGVPECFVASEHCEPTACGAKSDSCNELWKFFNQDSFGNVSCPYCMSGDDWTGQCVSLTSQSPIKIEWESVDTDERAMQFFHTQYNTVNATVVHNGYALMIREIFGSMNYDGDEYHAESVIIRSPAEHQIQGVSRADVEVQIVHRERYSRNTLMIAVLFDESDESDSVQMSKILDSPLPRNANEMSFLHNFDLNEVIDTSKPMMWYNGSLSVPPCSQPVTWGIQMGTNAKLSRTQVHNINSLFKNNPDFANGHGNNRKLQPLNGRRLVLRSNCGSPGAIACPAGTSLAGTDE